MTKDKAKRALLFCEKVSLCWLLVSFLLYIVLTPRTHSQESGHHCARHNKDYLWLSCLPEAHTMSHNVSLGHDPSVSYWVD